MKKSNQSFLRRLIIPILKRINFGDITIRHHWTGEKVTLHSFKHRNYWYRGKSREIESMLLFPEFVRKGDFVVEIGGHIGYISLYFAHLVGNEGQVTVFEPGPNNLFYLLKNTNSNSRISLVEKAVTDHTGMTKFYVEDLTGQNNSLLSNYGVLERNKHAAGVSSLEVEVVEVPCTTLDDFLLRTQLPDPAFVKIDVEGAELNVLNGMKDTLKNKDIALMVEVTENPDEVFSLLIDAGFQLFTANKICVDDSTEMTGNVFCVKGNDDRIRGFSSHEADPNPVK
jgi:FkbM family methyltransferase